MKVTRKEEMYMNNNLGPKYQCTICPYIYDPEKGDPTQNIPAGTPFADLPEDWKCPMCKHPKSDFVAIEEVIDNDSTEDKETMEALDMGIALTKKDVYVCDVCGWEYDPELGLPEAGIAPGTAFEDLPEDFVCPLCGAPKSAFSPKQMDTAADGQAVTNA
ncbi:rubredoxin [Faecalibaculum rodentium]|uniref:rubredoxin n=2 Tax=Faecalibaculum rodentium TaxID=1702221 RepID=UPI003F737934